jgi:hypothetical protein
MKRSKGQRQDSLAIKDGEIYYEIDRSLVWSFALNELWLIAERTTDHGPYLDDYFHVFAAGRPALWYEAPVYANPHLLDELSSLLGFTREVGLANRTDFASVVVWPKKLEGRPLFDHSPEIRGKGVLNRLKDRMMPLIHMETTQEVLQYVKSQAG